MPRRRKKSVLARKPELVFTESPVHIQNNVPSPVLCARHPPTASSVAIEDLHDLPWVSPQFRGVRHSGGHGKRRLTRQRRHSIAGHRNAAYCTNNKENVSAGLPSGLNKFKSLKFIGDQTTIPSIAEDVDITIDTDTGTEDDDEIPLPYNRKTRDRGNHCGKHNIDREFRNEKGVSSDELQFRNQRTSGKQENGACEKTGVDVDEIVTRKRFSLDLSDSSFEESGRVNGTQRRKSLKEKPPIKRLFASQLLPKCEQEAELCPGLTENVDYKDINKRMTDTAGHSETIQDSDGEHSDSQCVRRSARLQNLQKMLQSSESPRTCRIQTLKNTVLVPDTPENEYGWSKRKRQLIQYIKQKS